MAEHLKQHNIRNLFISLGTHADTVQTSLANIHNMNISYYKHPQLTDNILLDLQMMIQAPDSKINTGQPLVLILGDTLTNMDISTLVNDHINHHAAITRVIKNKNKSTGLYVLSPQVLQNLTIINQELGKLRTHAYSALSAIVKRLIEEGVISDHSGKDLIIYDTQLRGYERNMSLIPAYLQALRDISSGNIFPKSMSGEVFVDHDTNVIYLNNSQELAKPQIYQSQGNILVNRIHNKFSIVA